LRIDIQLKWAELRHLLAARVAHANAGMGARENIAASEAEPIPGTRVCIHRLRTTGLGVTIAPNSAAHCQGRAAQSTANLGPPNALHAELQYFGFLRGRVWHAVKGRRLRHFGRLPVLQVVTLPAAPIAKQYILASVEKRLARPGDSSDTGSHYTLCVHLSIPGGCFL
jgi:hypothetical protein